MKAGFDELQKVNLMTDVIHIYSWVGKNLIFR